MAAKFRPSCKRAIYAADSIAGVRSYREILGIYKRSARVAAGATGWLVDASARSAAVARQVRGAGNRSVGRQPQTRWG